MGAGESAGVPSAAAIANAIFDATGIRFRELPITPERDSAEPYRQVKVSLTLDCAMEPLASLLHDLEYGQPLLFVDSISIRRATTAPAAGGAGRLQVHLLLRGYLQPAAAGEPKA